MSGRLLSTQEVADRLGISEATLRAWRVEHRGLPYARVGKQVRYDENRVNEWLEANTTEPSDANGRDQ